MWKIYKFTNKTWNEEEKCYKAYIGMTLKSIEERFKEHCKYNYCKAFHAAILKYGENNWILEILENNIKTEREAFEKEEFYIDKHQTLVKNGKGYNLMRGSNGRQIINGKLKCYGQCQLLKKIDNFSKDKNTESGYCFICKDCMREYKLNNKEHIKIMRRKYTIEHREETKQKKKITYDKNQKLSLENLYKITPYKYCPHCKTTKKTMEFNRRNNNFTGFSDYCKICEREKSKIKYLNKKTKINLTAKQ